MRLVATVRFEEADGNVAAMLCGAAFAVPSHRTTSRQYRGRVKRMRDVPDIRYRDPSFLQLLPVVMRLDTNGYFRLFSQLGTIETVPDDAECHRGERRVGVWWRGERALCSEVGGRASVMW